MMSANALLDQDVEFWPLQGQDHLMTGAPFYGLAASSRFDEGKSPDTWKIEVHPYRDLFPSGVALAECSRGGMLQAGF